MGLQRRSLRLWLGSSRFPDSVVFEPETLRRNAPEGREERGPFVKRKTVILSTAEHTLQATHGTRQPRQLKKTSFPSPRCDDIFIEKFAIEASWQFNK